MTPPRRAGEEGSALVIALVMVFIVGVVAVAVMNYAGTSLRATSSVTDARESFYAADGAVDGAIQRIRRVGGIGYTDSASGCSYDLPAQGDQPAVHVECTPQTERYQPGNGGVSSDAPQYAILTLGQRANQPGPYNWSNTTIGLWPQSINPLQLAEPGIYFQPALTNPGIFGFGATYKNTDNVRVNGSIVSNSTLGVNTDDDIIVTNGVVQVRQACGVSGGGAISPGCQVIPGGYTDASFAQDPNYPHRGQLPSGATDTGGNAVGGFPAVATVPACGTSTLVKFQPGWYNDANAMNELFRTCANPDGTGKDYWFTPGTYYFDFRNTTATQACGVGVEGELWGSSPSLSQLAHQWCIRGKNVNDNNARDNRPHIIAGTPMGWDDTVTPVSALLVAATATSSDFTNPNNARTYNDGTAATASWSGTTTAQTMNGSTSSTFTNVNNARGAIDGSTSSTSWSSGASATLVPQSNSTSGFSNPGNGMSINGSSSTASWAGGTAPINATDTDNSDFNSSSNAEVIDGSSATYGSSSTTSVGEIEIDAFNDLPNGIVPTSASIRVAHRESANNVSSGYPKVDVLNTNGSVRCSVPVPLNISSSTLVTHTIAMPASCLLNSVANVEGARLRYSVRRTGSPSSTFYLDGIQIVANYSESGTKTFTASNLTNQIPGVAAVTSAELSVAHSESAPLGQQVVVTRGGGGTCAFPLTQFASIATQVIDVSSCLNTPARVNGATFRYEATGNGSGNVAVDGFRLDVDHYTGSTRSITVSTPTPGMPSVPGGSAITSVTMRVAHQESASAAPTVVIDPGGSDSGSSGCTISLTPSVTPTTETFNVASCLNTQSKINGATYTYNVSVSGLGSANGALDAITLEAVVSQTGNETITLGGFAPALPASANNFTNISLAVNHGGATGTSPRVVVTPGGGGASQTFTLSEHPGVSVDTVDLTSFLNTATKINGATARYEVTRSGNGTATLEGMRLSVDYTDGPDRMPDLPEVGCDDTQPGVQWIFGGDSRIYMPDGITQVCAGPAAGQSGDPGYTAQQIAVYGLPPTPTMVPSTIENLGGYAQPENAMKVGDAPSILYAQVSGASTGSPKVLRLSGFAPTAVPAGLVVTNVTARISHGEQSVIANAPSVTFTNGLGQNCGTTTLNRLWQPQAAWFGPASDEINITNCFNAEDKLGGAGSTAPVTANFNARSSQATFFDGIELTVTLGPEAPTTAAFVPQNGCITDQPNYWDGYSMNDCALWKWDSAEMSGLFVNGVDGQPNGQLSAQGTIYAPGAAIDIDDQGTRTAYSTYSGVDYPIFNRGIIVRHLRFKGFKAANTNPIVACGGTTCAGGKIANPRDVILEAYVCPPGAASCTSTDGQRRVEVSVQFPLNTGVSPVVSRWNAV